MWFYNPLLPIVEDYCFLQCQELQQPPTKKSRISTTEFQNSLQETHMDMERNFSSMNNSSFNTSMSFLLRDNMLTGLRSEEVNWEVKCSVSCFHDFEVLGRLLTL